MAGELAVRWDRQDDMLIMWLSGALDQATVTLLDRELDGRAVGMMRLVVDLTGPEFIDSPGLDALLGIHTGAPPSAVNGCRFTTGRTLPSGRSS